MKNGLYKVAFQTQLGHGSGVATVNAGRLSGGDTLMAYNGTIEPAPGVGVYAMRLDIFKHSDLPGYPSILGSERADLLVSVKLAADGRQASGQGSTPQAPGVSFRVTMSLIAAHD